MLGTQKLAVQLNSMTDKQKLATARALVNKSSQGLSRGKAFFLWAAATLIVTIVASSLGAAPVVSMSLSCLFGLFLGSATAETARSVYLNHKSYLILHSI